MDPSPQERKRAISMAEDSSHVYELYNSAEVNTNHVDVNDSILGENTLYLVEDHLEGEMFIASREPELAGAAAEPFIYMKKGVIMARGEEEKNQSTDRKVCRGRDDVLSSLTADMDWDNVDYIVLEKEERVNKVHNLEVVPSLVEEGSNIHEDIANRHLQMQLDFEHIDALNLSEIGNVDETFDADVYGMQEEQGEFLKGEVEMNVSVGYKTCVNNPKTRRLQRLSLFVMMPPGK